MRMARIRKMVSVTLDPELIERLERWIAAQEFPPTKAAAFDAALKLFLDSREGKVKSEN